MSEQLEIIKKQSDVEVEFVLNGRLDTLTCPKLEEELKTLDGIIKVVFDLKDLKYISSAGLRIILSLVRRYNDSFSLRNVSKDILEILEITGFIDFVTVE